MIWGLINGMGRKGAEGGLLLVLFILSHYEAKNTIADAEMIIFL